jgi:D-3-phosphoglycerate dehydrogenase / 2-oxoglutarate reductase
VKILCITPIKHLEGLYEEMESFGEVVYMPEITKEELIGYLKEHQDIDSIFTNPNKQSFKLDGEILSGSSVKLLNTASTGMNHIGEDWCRDNGVKVWSLTKDHELIKHLPATSELAFGLMLGLLRHIPKAHEAVVAGEWDYEKYIGHQAEGLTAGIVGFGRLGTFMAKYCQAFGMNVIVADPYNPVYGFDKVSLKTLVQESSVISLHVHVTDETRHMINANLLSKAKKKPYLINTARGEIVDEQAVIDALRSGSISGYGTDVIEDEYGDRVASPIIKAAQEGLPVLITPHIGGMAWEGQLRAYGWAIRKYKNIQG